MDSQGNEPRSLSNEQVSLLGFTIYDKKLRQELEPDHKGEWVAIHLETEEYFLGKTAKDAAKAARDKYPDQVFFVTRIGD